MSSPEQRNIVVVGSGGVGKSCMTIRFLKNEFSYEYDPTIEETFKKSITVDQLPVDFEVTDTAGQQEYAALRDQHYQRCEGFLLVFSITDKTSFQEMKNLHRSILLLRNTDRSPFVVAGNKCDLEEKRQVSASEAQTWCESVQVPYFETSAKANVHVVETFHQLVREIRTYEAKTKKKGGKKLKKRCLLQ